MDKIYGFKQKDVEKLIKYLDGKQGGSLSKAFEEFAAATGKSKGTVRNMYYAVAKKSREDKSFAEKYFGGTPITVQKISEFKDEEERELVKKILLGKKEGKSARKIIGELSDGDEKTALRYQNKYRNVLKNKQPLVGEIAAEIRAESGVFVDPVCIKSNNRLVPDTMLRRLQNEINSLLDRVTGKLKQENAYLRERLGELEVENIRLKNVLYGGEDGKKAVSWFLNNKEKNMLN